MYCSTHKGDISITSLWLDLSPLLSGLEPTILSGLGRTDLLSPKLFIWNGAHGFLSGLEPKAFNPEWSPHEALIRYGTQSFLSRMKPKAVYPAWSPSRWKGNDQDSMQSNSTSFPDNIRERNTQKSRRHRSKTAQAESQEASSFPADSKQNQQIVKD